MTKRFTDTELWQKEWFLKLPDLQRNLFLYIKDNCDCAGIYEPNYMMLNFIFRYEISENDILKINESKEQIIKLKNGRFFISDFIKFQYGELNPSNNAHKGVIKCLIKNNIDYKNLAPTVGLVSPPKESTGIGIGIRKGIGNIKEDFEIFYSSYPRKESKGNAEKAYDKALKDGVTTEQLLDGVKRYCKHIEKNRIERQFIKKPATWLNGKCWEDSYTVDLPISEPRKCDALKIAEGYKKQANTVTPEDQEAIEENQKRIKEMFKRNNLGKVG